MKVRCVSNSGMDLRPYEYEQIGEDILADLEHQLYTIWYRNWSCIFGDGNYYLSNLSAYLIDDDGCILSCPCQLFEVLDERLIFNWEFRTIGKDEGIYPFVQAILVIQNYVQIRSHTKI